MNKFLCYFLLGITLLSSNMFAQPKEADILTTFQELLEKMSSSGNKEAKRILSKAKENDGKIILTYDQMKALIVKWDPNLKSKFEESIHTAEIKKIKEEFEALLAEKVKEENPEAVAIAQAAIKEKGKMDFSIKEMKRYISKWKK